MIHPLEKWAKVNGKTQAWLAKQLGISQPAISRVFNGGAFSPKTAKKAVKLTRGEVTFEELVLPYKPRR